MSWEHWISRYLTAADCGQNWASLPVPFKAQLNDFCPTAAPECVHGNVQQKLDSQRRNFRKSEQESGRQTFRTTWMKSFGLCGLRPCSCRVQASKEDAWATISTLCPADGEEGVGRSSSGRKQHRPRTSTEVHLHRATAPKLFPDAAQSVSHQCSCSPSGYLWSLGSCGSCSSRKVRKQSACWLGSEVCGSDGMEGSSTHIRHV